MSQSVKFKSVDELLDFLPEKQNRITEKLRELILEELGNCREKLSYNVLFYFGRKHICFIWPGAIPWGKQTKEGVELGFAKAYLFPENSYLTKGKRKFVYIKTLYSLSDINEHKIRELLKLAKDIDSII